MLRTLISHVRRNVVGYIALFVALGGTAMASVIITSNSQVAQNTISGHKPPSGKHANIIAGSVNGQDVADNSLTGTDILESSLTGDAQKLLWSASASSSPPVTPIATVGPYTIKGQCLSQPGSVYVRAFVKGPSGTDDYMFTQTTNDTGAGSIRSGGLLMPANTDFLMFSLPTGASTGDYSRFAGTAMLRSGSTLVQVEFHAVADARSSFNDCFIYGTATRAT
jgi:hypothetical protein